jgi:hypothetical protein
MVSVLASSAVGRAWSGRSKGYKISICCFSTMHAELRRKSKDWLAQNQNNVSEWGNMSIDQARPTALEASTLTITPPMRVRYSWSSIWIRTRTYYFHVSFFFTVLIYLSCNFACLGYRIKFHHFILSITKLIIMTCLSADCCFSEPAL